MFKNPNLNDIINNNKKVDDNRLVIKSYTERNKKDSIKNNSINNNELKLNIPILKKTSNVISRNDNNKFVSTNSIISTSQLNQTLTSKSTENKEENNYRTKTYYIEYDPRWYFKSKLIKTRLEKATIASPILQQKFIED